MSKLIGKVKHKKKEIGLSLALLTAGVSGVNAQVQNKGFPIDSLQNYNLQEDSSVIPDTAYLEKDFSGWNIGNKDELEESEKVDKKVDKKEEIVYKDTIINNGFIDSKDGKKFLRNIETIVYGSLGEILEIRKIEKTKNMKDFNYFEKIQYVYDSKGNICDEKRNSGEFEDPVECFGFISTGEKKGISESSERTLYIRDSNGNIFEEKNAIDFDGDGFLDEAKITKSYFNSQNELLKKEISYDLFPVDGFKDRVMLYISN